MKYDFYEETKKEISDIKKYVNHNQIKKFNLHQDNGEIDNALYYSEVIENEEITEPNGRLSASKRYEFKCSNFVYRGNNIYKNAIEINFINFKPTETNKGFYKLKIIYSFDKSFINQLNSVCMERFVNVFNKIFNFRGFIPYISEKQCELKYYLPKKELYMFLDMKIEEDEQKSENEWRDISYNIQHLITLGTLRFIYDTEHRKYFDIWSAEGCELHFGEKIYDWLIDMEDTHNDYLSNICDKINEKGSYKYNGKTVELIYIQCIDYLTKILTQKMEEYEKAEDELIYG